MKSFDVSLGLDPHIGVPIATWNLSWLTNTFTVSQVCSKVFFPSINKGLFSFHSLNLTDLHSHLDTECSKPSVFHFCSFSLSFHLLTVCISECGDIWSVVECRKPFGILPLHITSYWQEELHKHTHMQARHTRCKILYNDVETHLQKHTHIHSDKYK